MQEKLVIDDSSGDKKYFTIVPNYILNHSTAVDQALYLQMKRFAGEVPNGLCFASKKTFMQKLGISKNTLKRSIKYLLDHKWIECIGEKKIPTAGGVQKVKVYRINDIWKLNTSCYKGGSKSPILSQRGVKIVPKGGSKSPTKKNQENKNYKIFPETEGEPRVAPLKKDEFYKKMGWM